MKRPLWILAAIVVLGLAAWWWAGRGRETVAIDLVQQFPSAREKRPKPESFAVVDATVAGVTRPAIFVEGASRIIWHLTIPDDAVLKFSLALKEEAWTIPGDGVLFRVGISDDTGYHPQISLMVNPYGNPADREWRDLTLDLSEFEGKSVDLVLATNTSAPGPPGAPAPDNPNGDLALWGAPRVVSR